MKYVNYLRSFNVSLVSKIFILRKLFFFKRFSIAENVFFSLLIYYICLGQSTNLAVLELQCYQSKCKMIVFWIHLNAKPRGHNPHVLKTKMQDMTKRAVNVFLL